VACPRRSLAVEYKSRRLGFEGVCGSVTSRELTAITAHELGVSTVLLEALISGTGNVWSRGARSVRCGNGVGGREENICLGTGSRNDKGMG
jgi:hypothetical protein